MSTEQPEPADFQPGGGPPRPPSAATAVGSSGRGRRSPLATTFAVLAVLILLLGLISQFWTEVLWYRQTGYAEVYTGRLSTQAGLFLVAAVLVGGGVLASMLLAYRRRPLDAWAAGHLAGMERYRLGLEPLRRTVAFVIPGALGLFAGSVAMRHWQEALLFLHARRFGTRDPQFHQDVGFYVFRLPMWQFGVHLLTAALVLSLVAGLATHYVYGGVRVAGDRPKATPLARRHLGLLLAAGLGLQAVSYWLSRYNLLTQNGQYITGATYTGINATLPTRSMLACIALMVAALFVFAAFRGPWRLPALGVALMLLSSVLLGGLYPAMVQQFKVHPSATALEPKYIERGIAATRTAYGLDSLDSSGYAPETSGQRGALSSEVQTAASIRIVDPKLVSPALNQVERKREYYSLPDPMDVDRYTIGGKSRDTVIGVREMDVSNIPAGQRQWVNEHTVYTHGYGVVAAYGNRRQAGGWPALFQGGLPGSGDLGKFEPRVYFGEKSNSYSIVGGRSGSAPAELDYFSGTQHNYSFTGDGGPRLSNPLTRLMFAVKFRDQNLLFTDAVNSRSQILYNRTPRERVEKVAPFLTVDGDAYPAVIDGRLKWIVDAYTTTNDYPYSQRQRLGDTTADTITRSSRSVNAATGEVNYLRNSVKATVDAYDGKVDLYSWDDDPIIDAWKSTFPGAVKPMSAISGQLMSHLRYPEDMFKAQREVLSRYHVGDGGQFFSGTNFWKVPDNPEGSPAPTTDSSTEATNQPPYYLTLKMPKQSAAAFSLTTPFVLSGQSAQNSSELLTGYLAADSNAGSTPGRRAAGYGKLRMLTISGQVDGPGQVENKFRTNPESQSELNLLSQNSSQVELGNLLTLPIAKGMLYVQPVYVKSSSGVSYSLLRKVLVNYGDSIGFADTLDAALNQVFGGDSGASAGDAGQNSGSQDGSKSKPKKSQQTPQQALKAALSTASAALKESREALAKNDFTAYGKAQAKLKDAIAAATAAQAKLGRTGSK